MTTFFMSRYEDVLVSVLRIVIGVLFMQHGVQKLFGWLTDRPPVELVSLMGLAGVLETFGGLLIVLGLFTRPVAFILSGEMAFAYFMRHFPQDFWPILNRGEPAALFCFIYLYLSARGAGPISLDRYLRPESVEPRRVRREAAMAD